MDLEELRAITEECERLTEREIEIRRERGVPDGVPIVTRESDEEVQQLVADHAALRAREDAFYNAAKRDGSAPKLSAPRVPRC